jgi:membrane protein YdbS with pleckstrin-like domain
MSAPGIPDDRAAQWVYKGMWGVLTRWFRVPQAPPTLPARPGETLRSFRPSEGWLRMRKFEFWALLSIVDGALLLGWIILFFTYRPAALWLALPWLAIMVLPDIVAYLAIHLRYDTTWYVLSDRSVRIRRGVWTIEEKTFTFENVQNVEIRQGPLQRWFGVANVIIQTAGGGGSAGAHGSIGLGAHQGVIEGVHDPEEIRESIMVKVRAAKGAGLGDSSDDAHAHASGAHGPGFSPAHLATLREIRDLAATLASRA